MLTSRLSLDGCMSSNLALSQRIEKFYRHIQQKCTSQFNMLQQCSLSKTVVSASMLGIMRFRFLYASLFPVNPAFPVAGIDCAHIMLLFCNSESLVLSSVATPAIFWIPEEDSTGAF